MEKAAFTREYKEMLQLLREVRLRSKITQVELAKRLEITQSAYSKLERGELRVDVIQLRSVCQMVGISLVEFVAEFETRLKKKTRLKRRK